MCGHRPLVSKVTVHSISVSRQTVIKICRYWEVYFQNRIYKIGVSNQPKNTMIRIE